MIIIKFFSSFGSSEGCIEAYTRVSELVKDPLYNVKYRFTLDDDYTHAILLNTAMPALKPNVPKENVIGLAFEPINFLGLTMGFVGYAKKNIGLYYIGQKADLPLPFTEHFAYMWHTTPLTEIPSKTKNMSLMISTKMQTSGHKYRHMLCERILSSDLPIDIWGNGCLYYDNGSNGSNGNNSNNSNSNNKDTRIKGPFESKEPYLDYRFHIAIENFQSPHYFSEKIMDPLICSTVPIYLGCENIDTYFPKSVIHLSGDIQKDMNLLTDICRNPDKYSNITVKVEEVKKTISFSNIVKQLGVSPPHDGNNL
jgi:Glycosyltransferase family 10 (fucosyltransferase) C-term